MHISVQRAEMSVMSADTDPAAEPSKSHSVSADRPPPGGSRPASNGAKMGEGKVTNGALAHLCVSPPLSQRWAAGVGTQSAGR